VVFESQLAFDDLFRAADSVLATAKSEGRNRARIEHLPKAGRSAGSPYPATYS
jgi:hypothetical protein